MKNFAKSCVVAALLAVSLPHVTTEAYADSAPEMQQLAESLRPRFVVGTEMPRYSLTERMAHYKVPGVAIGVIKGGRLVHAEGFGVLQVGSDAKVDGDSLFSAGSVSKVATAAMLLRMQAEGLLDMDTDVGVYLKSWHMPDFPNQEGKPVTLRMVLSHMAGFNIHGFGDFLPGQALPTVYDTLNGTGPAEEALTMLHAPGERYRYSGGGYTLAQLVATDVTGGAFPEVAQTYLFNPTGMTRSSFVNPLPETTENVAKAHDREGAPTALPRGYEAMPEMAASGLWTSARDLGTMVAALLQSYQGTEAYLPQEIAADMMTKVARTEHGLGPRLVGTAMQRMFHHGGANNSYRAWIEGHLGTGDGLVVLTNGTNGSALAVEIRNAAADVFGWTRNEPRFVPEVPVTPALLDSYTGNYAVNTDFPLEERNTMLGRFYDQSLTFSRDGENLVMKAQGGSRSYVLVPTAPNRFLFADWGQRIGWIEFEFHRDAFGKTGSITLLAEGMRSMYKRLQ